jgi:hypothetical protein
MAPAAESGQIAALEAGRRTREARKMHLKIPLVSIGCLLFGLSPSFATSLLPGQTVTNPSMLPAAQIPTAPSTAVSSSGANSLLLEGASWKMVKNTEASITFANGVWVDPTTGDLDFFYQIQNTRSASKAAPNNAVANSFILDDFNNIGITGVFQVSYSTKGTGCAFFGAGPCPPSASGSGFLRPTTESVLSVSRSFSGGGSDLLVNLSGPVTAGTNSAILVVQTNVKDFDQSGSGTFRWQAPPPPGALGSAPGQNTGGPWVLDALEPVPNVPEPGFYGELALGVAGLLLLVQRRRPRKTEA